MTSLSRAALYLGAKLTYMDEGIFVHQRGYLLKLLKKYGMDNCNSLKVPMSPSVHLHEEMDSPHEFQIIPRHDLQFNLGHKHKARHLICSQVCEQIHHSTARNSHESCAKYFPVHQRNSELCSILQIQRYGTTDLLRRRRLCPRQRLFKIHIWNITQAWGLTCGLVQQKAIDSGPLHNGSRVPSLHRSNSRHRAFAAITNRTGKLQRNIHTIKKQQPELYQTCSQPSSPCTKEAHKTPTSLYMEKKTSAGGIEVNNVPTTLQQADILTKPLTAFQHTSLLEDIGLRQLAC